MPTYDRYPAVDSGYNFPPEIINALVASAEFTAKFMQITRGTLPNGTWLNNLNTPTSVGTYSMLDSYTYTNAPSGLVGTSVLEVYRGSGNSAVLQRITQGANVYWRESIDAGIDSWSPWEKIQTKSATDTKFGTIDATLTDIDNRLRGLPLLPSTTDLDSLTTLGNQVYWLPVPASSAAAANQHFPFFAAGKLTSYFSGATNGIQVFETYTLTTTRYSRIRNTGGWTEWKKGTETLDAQILDIDNRLKGMPYLPGTTDLDTLMPLGNQVYWVNAPADSAASTAQHFPINAAGRVTTFFTTGSNGIQMFDSYNNTPRRSIRIRNSSGWQPWISADVRLDTIESGNVTRDATVADHELRLKGTTLANNTDLNNLNANLGSNTYNRATAPVDWSAQHYPINSGGMLRQFFFSTTSGMQIFEPYSQPARKYSRTRTIDGWTAWTSPEARLEYVETVLTNIAAIPEIAGNLKPDPVNPGFYLIGE